MRRRLPLFFAAALLGPPLFSSSCAEVIPPSQEPDEACEDGDCFAEPACSAAVPCLEGKVCKAGNCVSAPEEEEEPNLDLGGGSSLGGSDGGECIEVQVAFEPVIPTVALLIDQSGTMNGALGFEELVAQDIRAGGYVPWGCPAEAESPLDSEDQKNPGYRWNVVRSVLFDPENGIVRKFEDEVRFGLTLYTSRGGFGEGMTPTECPVLTEVPARLENYDSMLAVMRCDDIIADTPTREALEQVSEALVNIDEPGPKLIILATDGEPDTCECPFYGESAPEACRPSTSVERGEPPVLLSPEQAAQYDVVETARRIHNDQGIFVNVIDVSAPDLSALRAHLTDVAQAGGGKLFDGTRPTGLVEAFRAIVDGVRSCTFDLQGTIELGSEMSGTVRLDGVEVPLAEDPDDAGPDVQENGYLVRSRTQIELTGAPCETLQSGGHTLDIHFPCGAFEPIK